MQYRSFCIIGGGSSGWMSAATLKTAYPECEVSLIQPEGRKIIGVGESTLGHINRFFRFLGLKDKEWMPYCNATYKSSIAFKNLEIMKVRDFNIHLDVAITEITCHSLSCR